MQNQRTYYGDKKDNVYKHVAGREFKYQRRYPDRVVEYWGKESTPKDEADCRIIWILKNGEIVSMFQSKENYEHIVKMKEREKRIQQQDRDTRTAAADNAYDEWIGFATSDY